MNKRKWIVVHIGRSTWQGYLDECPFNLKAKGVVDDK